MHAPLLILCVWGLVLDPKGPLRSPWSPTHVRTNKRPAPSRALAGSATAEAPGSCSEMGLGIGREWRKAHQSGNGSVRRTKCPVSRCGRPRHQPRRKFWAAARQAPAAVPLIPNRARRSILQGVHGGDRETQAFCLGWFDGSQRDKGRPQPTPCDPTAQGKGLDRGPPRLFWALSIGRWGDGQLDQSSDLSTAGSTYADPSQDSRAMLGSRRSDRQGPGGSRLATRLKGSGCRGEFGHENFGRAAGHARTASSPLKAHTHAIIIQCACARVGRKNPLQVDFSASLLASAREAFCKPTLGHPTAHRLFACFAGHPNIQLKLDRPRRSSFQSLKKKTQGARSA